MAVETPVLTEKGKISKKQKRREKKSSSPVSKSPVSGSAKTEAKKGADKPVKYLRDENTLGIYLKEISDG